MFDLLGALFYLIVAALALAANVRGPAPGERAPWWNRTAVHWRSVALIFVLLAAWRIGQGEEMVQLIGRSAALAADEYDRRREFQGPIVAAALLAGGAWLAWLALSDRNRLTIQWSRIGSLAMLGYSAVRAISFHPVDAVIYWGAGPFHVNHLVDLGLAALTGGCAMIEARGFRRNRRVSRPRA